MTTDGFSIITVTNRKYCIENIFRNYYNQSFSKKELIIVINSDDTCIDDFDSYISDSNVHIFSKPSIISLGGCLNFAISKCKYDFIAKFDDDDYYGPYYIQESFNVFLNTECDVVGKNKVHYYIEKNKYLILKKLGDENKYTNTITGSTLCFKKSVTGKVLFKDISSREDYYFNKECIKNGYKIFSSSSYNHIIFKHADISKHTFISNLDILISKCDIIQHDISLEECFNIVDFSPLK